MERIVEINEDGRHLSKKHGFLLVEHKGDELGRVPLDEIGVVIANAHGLTYSNPLLVALAKKSIPLVLSDSGFRPVALMWPVQTHHRQAERMEAQIAATQPMKKRLWQELIRKKIVLQAQVLDELGLDGGPVRLYASKVKSGDTANMEGVAAQTYWLRLFGREFRRDRAREDQNAMLNYAYMVLRASTARAVMGAGLNPSLSIHHKNLNNPMRLVDDLMEPFRPVVDLVVAQCWAHGHKQVEPTTKRLLVQTINVDMCFGEFQTPVKECLHRMCKSLAFVYLKAARGLDLPETICPLTFEEL